jgi:phosphosulfolactate phosphohydrolase-like enzyme
VKEAVSAMSAVHWTNDQRQVNPMENSRISGDLPLRPAVWDKSWSQYKILGSSSPLAFEQKLLQIPPEQSAVLRSTCSIFVDVLRATTTLVAVAAAGCDGIFVDIKPKDRKFLFVPPFERGEWVYGGEQYGKPIQGATATGELVDGVIDNSPTSVHSEHLTGKLLRCFSTNGARALGVLSSAGFASVHALSFANVDVTIGSILDRQPNRIWFTCGGFYGCASLEDSIAAGMAISLLIALGFADLDDIDDEATAMLIQAQHFTEDGILRADLLQKVLAKKQVARLISAYGHAGDIPACVSGIGLADGLWLSMRSTVLAVEHTGVPFLVAQR